jgi:hypothetical protein
MVCALKNQPSPFHHDLDAEEIEKFIKPPEDQEVLDLEVELEIEIPNYLFTEQEFEEEMNDNFPSCTSFEQADPVDTITKKERSQKKKVIADVENAAKTRTIIVPKKLTTQS